MKSSEVIIASLDFISAIRISKRNFHQNVDYKTQKFTLILDYLNRLSNNRVLKCSWLSNTLSDFSCLGSCAKMPSCSALGCFNRSDKDPEERLSFHNLLFRNKKLAENCLGQLRQEHVL